MLSRTKTTTELDILTAVERGEVISQNTLARRVGVAVGLANAVLKRSVRKGFVKVQTVPLKRYAYFVTPTGFVEKSRLVAEFLDSALGFFRQARAQYDELFVRLQSTGQMRVVLVGTGELAEIALLAAVEREVTLVGILDPAATIDRQVGLPIFASAETLPGYDVFVITASRAPQEAYDQLIAAMPAAMPAARILFPPLLRIVPDRQALIVAAEGAVP